jgi:hypothetical protein
MQKKEYYGLGRPVLCVDTVTLVTTSMEDATRYTSVATVQGILEIML